MNLRPLWGARRGAGAVGASIAILFGLILNFSRFGYGLTHLSYDLPSALAPESNPSAVAIVQVDEELVGTARMGPGRLLDRSALARLVDRLREDQCRLVVLDIILDLESSKEADQQLAVSIKAHGNVVLAAAQEEKQRSFPETGIHVIQTRPRLPREEFLAAAKDNWGFCDVSLDTDSTIRRHYPGTDLYPSLPWKAACLAGAPACKEDSARWAPRWLRYYGPAGTLETLNYPEVFRKQKGYFSGKTVFVGKNLTTPFIDEGPDEFRTPYTRWNGRYMAGAEILATTFLNVLRGDWLTRLPPAAEVFLLVLFGAGFGFGFVLCRPAAATGYAFAGIIGIALIAWLLFCKCHVWFPWGVVAGGQIPCALLWAVISQSRGIAQEKERLLAEAKRLSREKKRLEKALAKKATPESGALPISSVEGAGIESVKDFELVKPVGKGAYGEVWLARNAVGMYEAVKLVYRDKLGSPESYEREFNGIRNFMPISLNQAGLLRLLHVGRSDREGFYYYVMELGDDEVSGREIDPANYSSRNLGKDLKRRGRIPLAECVDLGLSLSSTLEYLHSQQLVHRDIKPSNIIFVNGVPKLADIGLVTEMDRADMSIVGTPGFMDKMLHGTRAGDLASLGKVLYVCATGCAPEEFPRMPDDLSRELDAEALSEFKVVIAKACGLETNRAYKSAAEMHSDLERLRREISGKSSAGAGAPVLGDAGRIASLAVMPFMNLSGDPNQEYFADGITELLCDELGGVSALKKVTSRTTIMQYKGTTKKLRQIAAELGVDAVVEGSMQRDSNSVLVSVHLIDGRADRQLWAANYEREINGLLKLKTDLARAITSEIRVQLTPEEHARLDTSKPVSPAALDAYLKGRFEYWGPAMHWSQLRTAEDYYKQAVAIDPAWARAHAGLADVYITRMFQRGQRAGAWLAKAKESVQQALALDDCLAEAHTTAAWVKMMCDWDWPGAEREVCRAIQLNPSYSLAHTWYGHILSALGRFQEASTEMKRGQELDPLSPLTYTALPEPAYLIGDYSQALEIAQMLLNKNAGSLYGHFTIARVYLQQGKFEQSIAESLMLPARFWEIEVDPVLPRAYALAGRRAEALKALEELKTVSETHTPPAYSIASIHAALGEDDQAFRWLHRAYEERSGLIFKIGVDPAFRRLHADPRFHSLLKKMNLRI